MPRTRSHSASASSPVGAGTTTGPYTAYPDSNTIVGTPCAAVIGDDFVVVGAHVVGRGRVRDGAFDERRVEAGRRDHLRVHLRVVGLHTLVRRTHDRPSRTSDRRASLPCSRRISAPTRICPHPYDHGRSHGCFLPVLAVDVLEREEAPGDVERHLRAHVADPARRLVGVRAHRIEEPLQSAPRRQSHHVFRRWGGGRRFPAMTEPLIQLLADVWADVGTVCDDLTEAQWKVPTDCPGWSVQDNVAHMIGTEMMLLGENAPLEDIGARAVRPQRHRQVQRAVGRALPEPERRGDARRLPARHAAPARRAATRCPRRSGTRKASRRKGPGPYRQFMEIRVFDCWFHDQDIREALERPGLLEGAAADLSVGRIPPKALPYVVGKKAAAPQGSTVVFTVTGDTPLVATVGVEGRAALFPEVPADPSARLTMDRRTFTRLAGGRWTGDRSACAWFVGSRGRRRARRSRRREPRVHALTAVHGRSCPSVGRLRRVVFAATPRRATGPSGSRSAARRSARRPRPRSPRSRGGGTSPAPGTSGS